MSSIEGFYKKTVEERIETVKKLAKLDEKDIQTLKKTGALDLQTAERMIENVIGTFQLPLGIATNFLINGKEYLIPMVLEEPSVVAAASNAAKLCRPSGFRTESTEPLMVGQIQIFVDDLEKAKKILQQNEKKIFDFVNSKDSSIIKLGGGLKSIEYKKIETEKKMLIVNLLIDVRDSMGANFVNTVCEQVSPLLEQLTGGDFVLRILSNLCDRRIARAKAVWKKEVVGEDVVEGVLDAYLFAKNDVYRATTHNKGIMNGIDAVCLATGNDFRALEAGAHSYASLNGYKPLTKYWKNKEGDLEGEIEIPLAVGIVGGSTKTNPVVGIALKILGIKTARELAEIMAAVGLANNFAALRALSTEGIQRGHMKLHAKNVAVAAGAKGEQIESVSQQMIKENRISETYAKQLLGK